MWKKCLFAAVVLAAWAFVVHAQNGVTVPVAQSAASITELFTGAATGPKTVQTIAITVGTATATAGTFQFFTGTANGDACLTGRTAITGILTAITSLSITGNGLIVVPASRSFCIQTPNATAVNGWVTYLQQ